MNCKFIDLYCGIGGASCGFIQAGARPLLGIDNDPDVLRCWAVHAPGASSHCTDVEGHPLPSACEGLHLHSSTPCQLMSRQRRSCDSELEFGLRTFRKSIELPLRRGDHTWSSEQVPNARAIELVQAFERQFPTRVAHAVVDAADYGTPSTRTRLIVGPPLFIQFLKERGCTERVSMRSAFSKHNLSVPDGAVSTTISRGRGSAQNRARRLDNVGFTITASHPMTWLDENEHSLGCLSWRHSAALMGFPMDWTFPKSCRAAQRAVGNAIPPPLAKAMMEAVRATQLVSPLESPIPQEVLDTVQATGATRDRGDATSVAEQIERIEAELRALRRMLV